MTNSDFPASGSLKPKTDYSDQPPLDTREREDLKTNTSMALDELHKNLGGDFQKKIVFASIKTFDKGYGLRIRDDAGNRIGTAYKGEQVRILERKKNVIDSDGVSRNFIKVNLYNSRGTVDKKRSGWVAEDFIKIDEKHINELLKNLEKKIDKVQEHKPVVPPKEDKAEAITEAEKAANDIFGPLIEEFNKNQKIPRAEKQKPATPEAQTKLLTINIKSQPYIVLKPQAEALIKMRSSIEKLEVDKKGNVTLLKTNSSTPTPEIFPDLTVLYADTATSLDVSKNTKLTVLSADGVTSLDVSKNTKLTHLGSNNATHLILGDQSPVIWLLANAITDIKNIKGKNCLGKLDRFSAQALTTGISLDTFGSKGEMILWIGDQQTRVKNILVKGKPLDVNNLKEYEYVGGKVQLKKTTPAPGAQ